MTLARPHETPSVDLDAEITVPTPMTRHRVGTPAYMSPEQIDGARVDARSDQFSFCFTASEVLFGHAPFDGNTLVRRRLAIEHGASRPALRVAAHRRVWEVLRIGLAEQPSARHRDMGTLLAKLERARVSIRGCGTTARAGKLVACLVPC